MFSDISFGIDCILAVVPLVYVFPQLVKELRVELDETAAKRDAAVWLRRAAAAAAVLFLGWNAWNAWAQGSLQLLETWNRSAADTAITRGLYKGIYTSTDIKDKQEKTCRDLDLIAQKTEGPVYVPLLLTEVYVYMDRLYPTYSTWYVDADLGTRQIEYWRLFPEKRPQAIYVPGYSSVYTVSDEAGESLKSIERYFKAETLPGEAGTIYLISDWTL